MDITVLRKEELLLLAAVLGMDINSRLRKPEIRAAIEEVGFEEDELTDAWEEICRERNERAEEKEKQEKREQRQAEIGLERIKLEQASLLPFEIEQTAQVTYAVTLSERSVPTQCPEQKPDPVAPARQRRGLATPVLPRMTERRECERGRFEARVRETRTPAASGDGQHVHLLCIMAWTINDVA
ncbi:hypothetical protein HPB50_007475 [Hyalomma asiaticum]|uniref:Uncharacterized protein n=1 Tax=Hyalomma asiaticum TaxID=266040 RepID=A0ACB7SKG9_HYAAI|nr:hypothetical protein HPB50_007475 [Hyalomma asiaticum]